MSVDVTHIQEQLVRLNKIGIALSSEQNLTDLLALILNEARNFTNADAGSLYIREGNSLVFMVAQNETLSRQSKESFDSEPYKGKTLAISKESLAGYIAATGKILNIEDAYNLPENEEYHFYSDFDEENNYRTKSMLLIPLKEPKGDIVGVLQLINFLNKKGEIISFNREHEPLILSLASQAAVSIKNARLAEELKKAYLDVIFRLSLAAEYRDDNTASHLHRMSNYSALIAKKLGLPAEEVELIKHASPMHDIGKIGISDSILLKPGKLTQDEFNEMKKHTIIGAKILANGDTPLLKASEVIAQTHHEKFDGTGYPYQLKGKEIPLVGRIVALADVFDALTTKRCYKPAFPVDESLAIIRRESNKHFDPKIVYAFFFALDEILSVYKKEYLDLAEEST